MFLAAGLHGRFRASRVQASGTRDLKRTSPDYPLLSRLRRTDSEVLNLCGRYGKHLSLQIQTDMAHLASDRLAGPLLELFRDYREYLLPQNECIPPSYYLTQAAAWGLWLAGYCENWGMEPQWWWW